MHGFNIIENELSAENTIPWTQAIGKADM